MPILDYAARARLAEVRFMQSASVSAKNKEQVRRFLLGYDVSGARKEIFLRHIALMLERTEDIQTAMDDRERINALFKDLRENRSSGYYATAVNVSKRFVRWLNNGELPAGFQDLRKVHLKKQQRRLAPDDMVTWDDGLKLLGSTNDFQVKAIVATQLDGGFRPSEFTDLNYGDLRMDKQFCLVTVRDGKTGPRTVILWRAVPYLLRWLQGHPTKRKGDPLWIQERNNKQGNKRYSYQAMVKRVRDLGKQLGMQKPFDFYNLRHSACVIAKLDNIPEEEAAKKFGHSIQFYTATYGRMSAQDSLERISKVYGLVREKQAPEQTLVCPRCEFVNVPSADFCEKCTAALNPKKALEMQQECLQVKEELRKVQEQLNTINSFMNRLVQENPDVLDLLARRALSGHHGQPQIPLRRARAKSQEPVAVLPR